MNFYVHLSDTTFNRKLNFPDFSNDFLTDVYSWTVSTVKLWGQAHSDEGLRLKTKSLPLWNLSIHSAERQGLESTNKKEKTEQTQASVNTPHRNTDNKKNRALILRSQTLTSAPLEKQVHHLEYECLAWMASASWIKRTRASCFFDGDHTACSHRISVIRYYWFHNTHTVFQMYTFSYIKSSCYQYHLNQSWWWSDSVGAHRRMSSEDTCDQ